MNSFDHKNNFRTVWNKFKDDAAAATHKNVLSDYAFILQVNYVLGRAFNASIKVTDGVAIKEALTDMDRKGMRLSIAGLLVHKTLFE